MESNDFGSVISENLKTVFNKLDNMVINWHNGDHLVAGTFDFFIKMLSLGNASWLSTLIAAYEINL